MHTRSITTSLLAVALVGGCAGGALDEDQPGPRGGAGGKADQISGDDDPSGLLADAERRLSQLVTAADVGMTFGVDDDAIPYPDTYWPMVDNGIAVKWMPGQPSPLAKLVGLTA